MSALTPRKALFSIGSISSLLIFLAAILVSGCLLCRLLTDVTHPEVPAVRSPEPGR